MDRHRERIDMARPPLRVRLAQLAAGLFALSGIVAPAQEAAGPSRRSIDPVQAEMALNRGILEFEGGRYGQALERLANADPAGPGAAYYRGLSLMALRRGREALAE